MHKANILVVEDTEDIGLMLKMTLEYKNYRVILLHKPELMPGVLKTDRFDIIIMDMLLAGVNGIDICKTLRKNKKTKDTPIIMMSAHPDAEKLCLEAGATAFVAKPFDITDMLDEISADLPKQNQEGN